MKITRIGAIGIGIMFLTAVLLPGQTVVEAAKKEKERREALKGKTAAVVTNADLVRTKKKPAVTLPEDEETPPGEKPAEPPALIAPAPAAGLSSLEMKAEQARQFEQSKIEIEGRLKAAQEMVSLLNLKMAALQQQFYNFSNTTSRDQIQRNISETYQKIQMAAGDEAKIRNELEKFVAAGPSALSSIR